MSSAVPCHLKICHSPRICHHNPYLSNLPGECLRGEEKHTGSLLSALQNREEKTSLGQAPSRKERSPNRKPERRMNVWTPSPGNPHRSWGRKECVICLEAILFKSQITGIPANTGLRGYETTLIDPTSDTLGVHDCTYRSARVHSLFLLLSW